MKTIFLMLLVSVTFAFAIEFTADNSTAQVEQEQGLHIFYRCKPVMKYDYLGTIKTGLTMSDKTKEVFTKLVKKAKKEYSQGTGLIIANDMDKADVIKFKE